MDPSPIDPDEAIRDLILLNMVAGVGPNTCRTLLEHLGTATRVLDATPAELREIPGIGPKLSEAIRAARGAFDAGAELARCRELGVDVLARGAPGYPAALEQIPDPPGILYVKGTLSPRDRLAIALVGSRRCTPYGMRTAERLASSLARAGFTIVSGLARGIDASAHRGALKAGGRTLAVLANGLSQVYPPEHLDLALEVADAGALISEMPMTQSPLAGLFPQRNRIISGLCLGIVVVEAAPRSGSLSTASHAMEQNREVFAVPGPVDSLSSRGCHRLIRDGARLVESVEDILEELGPRVGSLRIPEEVPDAAKPEPVLSPTERSIVAQLDDCPVGVDELIARTNMSAPDVMATLSLLELKRLVKRMPGHQFVRAGST